MAAAVTSGSGAVWPCGGCLQVLHEFGPDMVVVVEGKDGAIVPRPLAELLPEPFQAPGTEH